MAWDDRPWKRGDLITSKAFPEQVEILKVSYRPTQGHALITARGVDSGADYAPVKVMLEVSKPTTHSPPTRRAPAPRRKS